MNKKEYKKWCRENGNVFTNNMHKESFPFEDNQKTRHNVSFKNNYQNPTSNYFTKAGGKTQKAKF